MNLRLCTTAGKLVKYSSKPTFKKSIKIDDNLIAALLNSDSICLDRPSYIGQSVLDLSKLRMYELQYKDLESFRNEFNCKINIVAGDTDSFFLEVINCKLEVLLPAMIRDNLLDTSNYNSCHSLYSKNLDSVIGKFKDENKGLKYKEWVFLRPKCYSLLGDEETKKAKGVTLKGSDIKHQSYLDCYNTNQIFSVPQTKITSKNHQIFTIKNTKIALTNADDKKVWVGKNTSLAYGHVRLSQLNVRQVVAEDAGEDIMEVVEEFNEDFGEDEEELNEDFGEDDIDIDDVILSDED